MTPADKITIIDQVVPDLPPRLAYAIGSLLALRGRSAPSLNIGGWKSDAAFNQVNEAIELRAAILSRIDIPLAPGSRVVDMWAMVNQAGSHHPRHEHRHAILSGIYYVDPGSAPLSPTIFEVAGEDGRSQEMTIQPVRARLVLFPGRTFHRVPVYQGAAPRITIAFDLHR